MPDDGRVALVSGASRGIGAAIGRDLLGRGWRLSLGLRDGRLPDWADPARCMACGYDATDPAAPEAWVAQTLARLGRIDAVVASAGILVPGSVIELDDEGLDAMWEVNVKGPRRLVRAAWEPLKATGAGRVIVLASLSGKRIKSPGSGGYGLTKFAAVALTHGIRQAGHAFGIRATAICPSYVATDMTAHVGSVPAAEMTRPEEVATLVGTLLGLPNEAVVAELCINYTLEPSV